MPADAPKISDACNLVEEPSPRPPGAGPRTHVLIVGVSRYTFFAGGTREDDAAHDWEMDQLSAAALSASRVAEWFLTRYRNPDAPLGSLRILLSPGEKELPPEYAGYARAAATRANFAEVYAAFKRDCARSRDNVAFVYAAGHGVQLTKDDAILLLEDAGDPDGEASLSGAADFVACHRGMDDDRSAATQFWFLDACRQRPEIARRFEQLRGAFAPDAPLGGAHASHLFLAASPRQSAYARIGDRTLFSEALLEALETPNPPSALCPEWHVSAHRLSESLTTGVARRAAKEKVEQTVFPTGNATEAIVHRFEGVPKVELSIDTNPKAAYPGASLSLVRRNRPVQGVPTTLPFTAQVDAGIYVVSLGTPAVPALYVGAVDAKPPATREDLEVGG